MRWEVGTTLADVHEIHYSAFRQQVQEGNVEQVTVSETEIIGQLKEPAEGGLDERDDVI